MESWALKIGDWPSIYGNFEWENECLKPGNFGVRGFFFRPKGAADLGHSLFEHPGFGGQWGTLILTY